MSVKNTNTQYVLLELKAYGRLGNRALVATLEVGWLSTLSGRSYCLAATRLSGREAARAKFGGVLRERSPYHFLIIVVQYYGVYVPCCGRPHVGNGIAYRVGPRRYKLPDLHGQVNGRPIRRR